MTSSDSEARDALQRLDARRKALEFESCAIVSELTSPPQDDPNASPMGIDTPLVDGDGYPRSDIDVVRARHLRHRLAEIRTDHRAIQKEIETNLLHTFTKPESIEEDAAEREARLKPKPKPKFDPVSGKWVVKSWDGTISGIEGGENRVFDDITASSQHPSTVSSSNAGAATSIPEPSLLSLPMEHENQQEFRIPFAIVDSVAPQSPAELDGICRGDILLEFGTVNHTNHDDLKAIMELVPDAAASQRAISMVLLRDSSGEKKRKLNVMILPRFWAGRGLLGCHIVPFQGEDTTFEIED